MNNAFNSGFQVPVVLCLVLWAAGASPVLSQDPMTLESCTGYALEHSRELAQLRLDLTGQELATLILRGKFRPDLDASTDHSLDENNLISSATLRQEVPMGVTAALSGRARDDDDDEDDDALVSIRVSKIILGGGSLKESMLEITNSLLDELINLNRLHRYERELVFLVKQNYYRIIQSYQTLRVNELQLERSKKNLEHALERERPLDIATAQIEVPENEAGVLRANRQIESALDSLKNLIGMDVEEDLQVDTGFSFVEEKIDIERDTAFCLSNHEDLLNAGLQKEKLENQWPVQRARRWPKLTLSTGVVRDNDEGVNLDGDTETTFGLALAWELGGKTERLKADRIVVDIESNAIDITDIEQEKIRNIRDLARRIRETLELVKLQQQKIEVAKKRVELYDDRWQNGEIDILEFIRSQNELENSRIQLINLQTNYMDLLGEYDFTVGR